MSLSSKQLDHIWIWIGDCFPCSTQWFWKVVFSSRTWDDLVHTASHRLTRRDTGRDHRRRAASCFVCRLFGWPGTAFFSSPGVSIFLRRTSSFDWSRSSGFWTCWIHRLFGCSCWSLLFWRSTRRNHGTLFHEAWMSKMRRLVLSWLSRYSSRARSSVSF